ncbi:MAG TPA: hydrogenase expression/formation protein HypE [Thermoanaerobaculia bacterium]|jgi:hydrogenase expression/formation protein HypE|nr:hydrogenase expression/formation protein HypE [Thermoanaerobaculia bacterium]
MGEQIIDATLLGACPVPLTRHDRIVLGHGSGGKLSAELIETMFLPAFRNEYLDRLDDQAVFDVNGSRLAFTTDSFVVTPIFFPGGDIGRLAVNGTVNDLAMSGARPLYLSVAFILEEGLLMGELQRIVESMRQAAAEARVLLVTGDTKVVNRGKGDKIFINTAGVGLIERPVNISASGAKAGDKVIVSGYVGDHGMAILSQRENLTFESDIESDTAPLYDLVEGMLEVGGIHCLRDPTRGGVATTLNEIAQRSKVSIEIDESAIPVRESVRGACEILGLDPLYVANEGKLVAIVDPVKADAIVAKMRTMKHGADAQVIGTVVASPLTLVFLKTDIGGTRVVDLLWNEQLPRIC